ncbi:hypothetical protein BK669_04295 [Pseudomonas fluorescens]|nr:hypothetical protein BK669_04295 [Pseudomonas fluorescens]
MKGILKGFVAGILALGVFLYGCNAYVNVSNPEFFGDIKNAAPIMAQVFGIAGLAWMVIYSILSAESSKVKLIGSGLVLSLAFAANNVWTYGLSIFIVATLVTELQFLEKLAAMFTNRDKYWDFLAQQSTPEQSKQKAILEAVESVETEKAEQDNENLQVPTPEPTPEASEKPKSPVVDAANLSTSKQPMPDSPTSLQNSNDFDATKISRAQYLVESRAKDILKFQDDAFSALKRYVSALEGAELRSQMRFHGPGFALEVDALLKMEAVDYIVEIKNTKTFSGITKAQLTLSRLMSKYGDLIASARVRKQVRGILIVPKDVWVKREELSDIVVLELDQKTNTLSQVDGNW